MMCKGFRTAQRTGPLRNRRLWNRRFTYRAAALAMFVVSCCLSPMAQAGGGPETTLLIVNSASAGSKTIANYYQSIRKIPSSNVVYIDWSGSTARTDINTFRDKILMPVLRAVEEHEQLGSSIDCVTYSSDFPWAINFTTDIPAGNAKAQIFQNPEGSLTGLTYLYVPVLSKQAAAYCDLAVNRYMRLREMRDDAPYEMNLDYSGMIPNSAGIKDGYKKLREKPDGSSLGSHGFKNWYGWGPKGELIESGGIRYILSTTLGITFGRGNTVGEVVNYLQRGPTADGKSPRGTIYFMDNADVRSTTRKPGFLMATEQLKLLKVAAQIEQGDIPLRKNDVQGLLCGISDFDWKKSGSTILPGAICENLTSYGAIFDPTAVQTPISEFMRNGAAGTSGTVAEPFSIQNKFPHPMVQVHYARGCTLAEAFYQAVYSPYQLLIVGDPLCQPWANIPQVKVDGLAAGDTLKGKVAIKPSATLPRRGTVDRFELYVDGGKIDKCGLNESLELDTSGYADGYHEVRIVGIEKSTVETRGNLVLPVTFNNYGKSIEFGTIPKNVVRGGIPIKLVAKSPGAIGVAFYHNQQVIAKFNGESGEASVDSKLLGEGPVTLRAIGWGSTNFGDVSKHAASAPIQLTIENGTAGP
jgi:hypothetical protein